MTFTHSVSYFRVLSSNPGCKTVQMPAKDHDFRMEDDSDSDMSLLGDEPSRSKVKGKGKASDKPKKDKRKGKVQDVVSSFF